MTAQVKIDIPADIIYLLMDFISPLTTGEDNVAECVMFQQKKAKWNIDHEGLKDAEGLRDPCKVAYLAKTKCCDLVPGWIAYMDESKSSLFRVQDCTLDGWWWIHED